MHQIPLADDLVSKPHTIKDLLEEIAKLVKYPD
jgi:hypothetical protein